MQARKLSDSLQIVGDSAKRILVGRLHLMGDPRHNTGTEDVNKITPLPFQNSQIDAPRLIRRDALHIGLPISADPKVRSKII